MDHDGGLDARDWTRRAPLDVVVVVRDAIAKEPTPRALRLALYRTQLASEDEWTSKVADRCHDRTYGNNFGKALLRAEVTT